MILAHAFGARYDLPIPLLLFVLGGALVVIFSFLLVLRRGDDVRLYDETGPDVPGPVPGSGPQAASATTTATGATSAAARRPRRRRAGRAGEITGQR